VGGYSRCLTPSRILQSPITRALTEFAPEPFYEVATNLLSLGESLGQHRDHKMLRLVSPAIAFLVSLSVNAFAQELRTTPLHPLANGTAVTLVISSHQAGTVAPTMIGIKSSKAEFGKGYQFFTGTNARAVSNLKALSPIPGQSCLISIGADGNTTWIPDGPPKTPGQISRADIDALASFLKAANCKLDYTAAILNNTPASAAEELAYVNSVVGEDLLAVGFGNEPDGAPYTMSAVAYAESWHTFAQAALARENSLRFKGPETGIATDLGVWLPAWYERNSSVPLAYATQHFYVAGPAGCPLCTESLMLEKRNSEAYWNKMVLQKIGFEAGLAMPLPVLLTETNNFYQGGAPGVSNSYGSALYAFDFVFQAAEAGFGGTAFTIVDNWSNGYSPLNIVNGYSYGPRPEFYGMYMAALAGYGPLLSTTIQNADGLHAYTINDTIHGTLNTAFVNTTNIDYEVHARYPAGISLRDCSLYVMSDSAGITDTLATDLNIQGGHFDSNGDITLQSPESISVEGATANMQIPAYSGVLVKCTH
jgi:hypothetical protein